jgi:antitoxin component of RelBE/YafQ-DinJ toxin-antitoxin module
MNNKPKIFINIKVDPDLQTEFESLKEIHGLTFTDALEAGMKETIRKVRYPEETKRKIDEMENKLSNLYDELCHAEDVLWKAGNDKSDFRWG